MQKKIIALAIAAACAAPVAALADVAVYGSMDGGLRHQSNEGAAGTTDSMKMGQYNTARWGFKAVDDLGDGMKANVVLETSFVPGGVGANPDMNTKTTAAQQQAQTNPSNPFGLIFDRQATVGLEGGFGKFDMGWGYTTSFNVIQTYDPFNYKFNAIALAKGAATEDRRGNVVYGNKFGDVAVTLEYDMSDAYQSRGNNFSAPGRAVGVTYASGAINVGAAYTAQEAVLSNPATGLSVGYDNSYTHMTVGAGYNYGDGKVSVGYAKKSQKVAVGGDSTATNMWLGASHNVTSKTAVTAAYYKKTTNAGNTAVDQDYNTMMAMVTYALSKKTSLYLEADRQVTVGSGGASDVVVSGTSAGLDVKF